MPKHIVILGGGPAGIAAAQALLKNTPALPTDYKIIVIEKRDFYWHVVAGLRSPLDEKLRNEATIPYDRVFKGVTQATVVRANVTAFDAASVHTDASGDHSRIPYQFLILATGRIWSKELYLPIDRTEAIETLRAQGDQIAAAKRILVVGGGSAGIELAGEIAEKYQGLKEKEITLIHRGRKLLNDIYPNKLRDNLQRQLETLGVIVKNGEEADPGVQAGNVTLKSGATLTCDLVFETTGGRANSDLIKKFDPAVVSTNGFVKVDQTFQLPGHPNIFAIGDIADLPEQKQVAKIKDHAPVVAMNIVSLIKENKTAKVYKPPSELIIVTVGRKGGAGLLFGSSVGSFIASNIKSKGLFVSPTRKTLGY